MTPENKSCLTCDQPGQIKDTTNQLCVPCLSQCSVCASLTTCASCVDYYFLASPTICIPQQKLFAQLNSTFNPQLYKIKFSQQWSVFFGNLINYAIISISGIANSDYSYNIYVESVYTIAIKFAFKAEVKNTSVLNVMINYTDLPTDQFSLQDKNLSTITKQFCPIPTTYLQSLFLF